MLPQLVEQPTGEATEHRGHHLEAHEVDRAQTVGVAGLCEAGLGTTDAFTRGEASADARQPPHERPQGAVHERLLELDLLEAGDALEGAQLRQPRLDGVGGA